MDGVRYKWSITHIDEDGTVIHKDELTNYIIIKKQPRSYERESDSRTVHVRQTIIVRRSNQLTIDFEKSSSEHTI